MAVSYKKLWLCNFKDEEGHQQYLSDTEIKFLKENEYTDDLIPTVVEEDDETVKWIQRNIGYFISYGDLFSTWIAIGKDFDVSNVRDALSAFSRLISPSHKKVFEGVFDTLQAGLSKLGDSSGSQTIQAPRHPHHPSSA